VPTITPPFQRRITNPLQRPLSSDLNLQAFYDSVTQSYMAGAVYSASPGGNPTFDTGFVGNSFRCFASTTSREVVVQKGVGFIAQAAQDAIGGIVGVNSGSYSPVVCEPDDPGAAGISLLVTDLGAGLDRIDVVCVKSPNEPADYENIGILNPTASTFSFLNKPTQFTDNAFDTSPVNSPLGAGVRVITGTASAGTPTVPTIPSGYLEIARIYVPVGAGNLVNSDIEDRRPVLIPHGARSMELEFDSQLGQADPAEVVGFDFGNNGVHAVVRPVYSGSVKYFEVYVSSGAVNPSVFRMVAGGFSIFDGVSDSYYHQTGLACAVKSRATVTRLSALHIFAAAGTYDALIGPMVAKFIVVAGEVLNAGGSSGIEITTGSVETYNAPIRLSLFAQAF